MEGYNSDVIKTEVICLYTQNITIIACTVVIKHTLISQCTMKDEILEEVRSTRDEKTQLKQITASFQLAQ